MFHFHPVYLDVQMAIAKAYSMNRSYVLNVILGIGMLITMLFCIGDLNNALSSSAPYQVLFENTGKNGVAMLLNVILFLLIFSGNITALATCSREIWAFSRDRGFPFSKWISHVSISLTAPHSALVSAS